MTEHSEENHEETEHGDIVGISVNNVSYQIHRGAQPVSEIKRIANVPQADELEELADGKLIPLNDDARVEIKGGEIFVSHGRAGKSS